MRIKTSFELDQFQEIEPIKGVDKLLSIPKDFERDTIFPDLIQVIDTRMLDESSSINIFVDL